MAMPRKLRCTVESVADHGGRVYTVDLKPEVMPPNFRPGQFLHLTVDPYDPSGFWPESRVFSIASPPRHRQLLRLCYSVKGQYTLKMEQSLKPGAQVWIKLPYGQFVIDDSVDAVLLAGGTGISAFTAFIEALSPENSRRVWLVYGARDPTLFLFGDMILAQLNQLPNFSVLLFAETASADFAKATSARIRAPLCLPGRIALDQVWPVVPEPAAKVFYLSGPPVMLNTLGSQLQARGVAPDRIRTDAWE